MAGYQRQATANIQPDLVIDAADLNNEYNAIESAFNANSGHKHDGSPGEGARIPLGTAVTGTLPLANGGTGATTASSARTNLGLGTVATYNTLPIANGGTGATTASDARTNLGLGTVVTYNIGTSGSTIPLLDGINSWTNKQTFNNGISLGSNVAPSPEDLSKHLSLYGSTYGFSVTGSTLNHVSEIQHKWYSGANEIAHLQADGTLHLLNVLTVASGGTGAKNASDARTNLGLGTLSTLSPTGTANSSTFLRGDGTWASPPSSGGTVTSIGLSAPTGFTVSGSPVTSSGTLTLSFASGYEGFTTSLKNLINTSVQTSGNQTVNGIKTFSSGLAFSGTAASDTRANLQAQRDLNYIDTIELGNNNLGDRTQYIDFHTTAVAVDQNARIIRYSGTNGDFGIYNSGTGNFTLSSGGNLSLSGAALTFNSNVVWHQGNLTLVSQAGAEAGTDTGWYLWSPQRVAQAIAAQSPGSIGYNQTWSNPSRSVSTSYQNTTGKPIQINASFSFASTGTTINMQVSTDNSTWVTLSSANIGTAPASMNSYNLGSFIIPPNHYYRAQRSGGSNASITSWAELS